MANGASRIDSSDKMMASIVLPQVPFTPTPSGKRVVTADELAEWNKQHHRAMTQWLERLNAILQRAG